MLNRINKLANLESYRNGAVVQGKQNPIVLDSSMSTAMAVELLVSTFGERASKLAEAIPAEVARQRLAEKVAR